MNRPPSTKHLRSSVDLSAAIAEAKMEGERLRHQCSPPQRRAALEAKVLDVPSGLLSIRKPNGLQAAG